MIDENHLKQCTIVLTRDCNLRCSFCYVKRAGYCAQDTIDYADLQRIVDFCSEGKVKYIFFTGGEPLLYPGLTDILQYIKDKYPLISTAIASNGILLEDFAFCKKLVNCGVNYIDISIKGKNPQEWSKITGYNGFAEQLQAIRNLSTMPVEFTCSIVITPENVLTFCDAVQLACDSGAKQISFTFFIDNNDDGKKGLSYLKDYNPISLIAAFLSQMKRLNTITDDWWIEYSFPICFYSDEQLRLLEGRLATPCQIHMRNAITFNTNMELLPCDMYIDQTMGQLNKDFSSYQEFTEWIQRPAYRNVMETLRKWPSKKCSSCRHLEYCYGGCPVLWRNYSFEDIQAFRKAEQSNKVMDTYSDL